MARRKGISKAKTSAKKSILEENDAHKIESELRNVAKDDSEDCGNSPTMEIVQNKIGIIENCQNNSKEQQHNKIQKTPELPIDKKNDENRVSDLKYLHKKFKRLASATLSSNTNNSNVVVKNLNPPSPNINNHPPKIINSVASTNILENKLLNQVQEGPSLISNNNNCNINNKNNFNCSNNNSNSNHQNSLNLNSNQNQIPKINNQNNLNVNINNEKKELVVNGCIDYKNSVDDYMNRGVNKILLSSDSVRDENEKLNNNFHINLNNNNNNSNLNQYGNIIYVSISPSHQQNSQQQGRLSSSNLNLSPKSKQQIQSPPILQIQNTNLDEIGTISGGVIGSGVHHHLQINDVNTNLSSSGSGGRHVCPYCQLNCSKPSVLQKHIRAHTNERPFPCGPCGCAFKTKSNLYKHQRSRTHSLRIQGVEQLPDDEMSLGSDVDQEHDFIPCSTILTEIDERIPTPIIIQQHQQQLQYNNNNNNNNMQSQEKPYKPKFHNAGLYNSCGSERNDEYNIQPNTVISNAISLSLVKNISTTCNNNPMVASSKPTTQQPQQNIYPSPSKNVEVAQRINKLIMDNEAIVEGGKPLAQKKSLKIQSPKWPQIKRDDQINKDGSSNKNLNIQLNIVNRISDDSTGNFTLIPSTPPTPQQSQQQINLINPVNSNINNNNISNVFSQPLNLTKPCDNLDKSRKRSHSEGFSGQDVTSHPQNPERSIIKDLLLNPKNFGAISTSEIGESVFTCPFCKISFRNAENLKYHTICYCQGSLENSPQSTPRSLAASPSSQQIRLNSIHGNYSEKYNPNSLAKLASTSLRQQPYTTKAPKSLATIAKSQIKLPKQKLENIVINSINSSDENSSSNINTNTTATTTITTTTSNNNNNNNNNNVMNQNQSPLLSPGPLLGNIRLVHSKNSTVVTERNVISCDKNNKEEVSVYIVHSNPEKTTVTNNHTFAVPILIPEETYRRNSASNSSSNSGTLQMFGGDVQVIEKHNDGLITYGSGGSVKSLSPQSQADSEPSPIVVGAGLLSGGSAIQLPQTVNETIHKTPPTPKLIVTIAPTLTPTLITPSIVSSQITHFQFPPINSITAYNPLTLPPITSSIDGQPSTILHGGKTIPFVPGIPGPNTNTTLQLNHPYKPSTTSNRNKPINNIHTIPNIKINDSCEIKPTKQLQNLKRNDFKDNIWSPARMAENVSPVKSNKKSNEAEIRHFNYENLISKTSIFIKAPDNSLKSMSPSKNDVNNSITSVSGNGVGMDKEIITTKKNNNFLRPTSLPLKPGTFQQKKHHGITPTQNTMPLISPETPRPSKNCIQLYLNGHAYTYLGLKCSTKMTYCTVNRAQPVYIMNQHKLSMYSEWRTQGDYDPHPMGFSPRKVISLYDSRQMSYKNSIANSKNRYATKDSTVLVHSQSMIMTPFENQSKGFFSHHSNPIQINQITQQMINEGATPLQSPSIVATVPGGYESNEDYTYVRGRGRGRYVCSECGIRCKKPSMLKKHIRTHTDVRPYTCNICSFSFKTKGNLTKHMKSKAHYKKCIELGLNPLSNIDDDSNEMIDTDQVSIAGSGRTSTIPGDSDTDDYSDGDDGESESSDADESKSRLPEHEAARCLISLSMTPPNSLINSVYPENLNDQSQNILNQQRRIITTYPSAKNDFNSLKHEQYYSNPNLHKSNRNNMIETSNDVQEESMPIDLTKPKNRETFSVIKETSQIIQSPTISSGNNSNNIGIIRPVISEVITPSKNPAHLLTSIVSIMDKIPNNNGNLHTHHSLPNIQMDESKLLQQYLTERALQDTKIKQSQMIKSLKVNPLEENESTITVSNCDEIISKNKLKVNYDSSSMKLECKNSNSDNVNCNLSKKNNSVSSLNNTVVDDNSKKIISDIPPNTTNIIENKEIELNVNCTFNAATSGIDTLAEIAANSTKLPNIPNVNVNDNAKSVASEYLKVVSNETKRTAKISFNEDDEIIQHNNSESSDQDENSTGKILQSSSSIARTVVVGEDGFKNPINDHPTIQYQSRLSEDGRAVCNVCSKTFQKEYHLLLHYNIHYIERKFRCEPCGISFRTKGHLQKHERSVQHHNKVSMTSTFGVATTSNPRPFKCLDCKVAFRIHGHLAKHLRSKSHVMKLECIGKLPFGMYAEIERAGVTLTDIDTTDCDNSLNSLLMLAQKLQEKDPTKFGNWQPGANIELLNQNSNLNNSNCGIRESDSDDSDTQNDDQNQLSNDNSNIKCGSISGGGGGGGGSAGGGDSAFSSDSSSGSIKRKIDAIAGSLDPMINHDENTNKTTTSLNVHKRLKTLNEI